MRIFEIVRTFFIILSVTLVTRVVPSLTITEWVVVFSIALAGTGVSIAVMSMLGIRDKDILK